MRVQEKIKIERNLSIVFVDWYFFFSFRIEIKRSIVMIGLQSVTRYSRTTEARRETRDLFYIDPWQLTDRQFIGYLRHKAVNRRRSWTVPLVEEVLAQTAGITRETAINFLRIYGTPTGLARDSFWRTLLPSRSRDFPIENSKNDNLFFFKILEDENSNPNFPIRKI